MKKLNKKGFTLVELLAVIVILALLIVVVATTALPALDNAKKSSLKTYSQKVIEQAKTLYTTECVLETDANKCASDHKWYLADIMGSDVSDQYEASLTMTKDGSTIIVAGIVVDAKNGLAAQVNTSKVTGTEDVKANDCAKFEVETNCNAVQSCTWASGSCGLKS